MLAMRGERMRGIRNLGGRAGMLPADRMRWFLRECTTPQEMHALSAESLQNYY